MALSVTCSGCQSQYSVPDNMAGKRAKCKKCGEVLVMPTAASSGDVDLFANLEASKPAASGSSSGSLFGDLESTSASPSPTQQPKSHQQAPSGSSLFGSGPTPAQSAYSPVDSSIGDALSLGNSPSGSPYGDDYGGGAPSRQSYRGSSQGGTGAAVTAAILATLLSVCGAGIMFVLLSCSGDFMLALLVSSLGVVAAIACCVLGIVRMPGLSWSVFGLYGAVCLLGIAKAGMNAYSSGVGFVKREVAKVDQQSPKARFLPHPRPNWPESSPTSGGNNQPAGSPFNHPSPPITPWKPEDDKLRELRQPRTEDWKVTVDAPPDWAQVGAGREFSLMLEEPNGNPVRYAHGYARAIALDHRLGGQDVFEVWDLGTRKKVGALKGRNAFHRHIAISPDGQFVAGEVRPEAGRFGEPIQVWSMVQARKVCEINPPAENRQVEIIDFASQNKLFTVYETNGRKRLSIWNVADGSLAHQFELGTGHFSTRHYALSPGRQYFATYDSQTIRFYDLTASLGAEAGTIYLPSNYRCEALAFSPDGAEIAALCDADFKSHMLAWDAQTGAQKSQQALESRSHELHLSHEEGGGLPIAWLSSGEGWLVGGKRVLSRKDGSSLWTLPAASGLDRPAKLLDADQLVTVEQDGLMARITMRPFPFGEMDSVNRALAAGGTAIDARLPPLGKAQWEQVEEIDLQPGVAWNVALDPRPSMKPGVANKAISLSVERVEAVLFSDPTQAQAVVLEVDRRSPERTELSTSVSAYLQRFDLGASKVAMRQKVPGGSKLLAISPSGKRAALTIGTDEARLDVYSLGESPGHVCAWRPYIDENPKVERTEHQKQQSRQSILWAGFVDEEHLLTMNRFDGQLVLWKVPEMQAVYRLRTGSGGTPALSPTGKYVVVQPLDRLTLIEAKTGQVKGELPVPYDPPDDMDTNAIFSADGSRLAATISDLNGAFLLAYDVKAGKEIARMPLTQSGRMQWCGTKQLIVGGERGSGGNVRLVDLERRAVVWRFNVFSGYRLPSSPDDRVWLIAGGYHEADSILIAQPFQLTGDVTAAIAALPAVPQPLFGPGTAVAIDTSGIGSAGSPDLADRVRTLWTNHLESRGVRVGEGGLRLVASSSNGESRTETYGNSPFRVPTFPGRAPQSAPGDFTFTTTDINMEVRLVDSGGKTHWQTKSVARFHLPSSIFSGSDGKSPQQILADSQAAQQKANIDAFYTSVRLPYMIFPQPVDKDGQPGLGFTPINLSGYVRDKAPTVRPSSTEIVNARDAVQEMYGKVLADNPQASSDHWQWCQGLERPVVALRWGLGVQIDMPPDKARIALEPEPMNPALLRDLGRVAGPIGPMLVQTLRTKQSEGKCGEFADVVNDELREVMLLGSGERAQLAASARKAMVDLVVIIKLDAVVRGRQRDKQLSLEVLDMGGGKKVWVSEALLESRVGIASAQGRDLLQELNDLASEELDEKLELSPIGTMPPTVPEARAAGALHRSNPLASLAEVDWYLCRDQIPAATAATAFAKLLGNPMEATALASDDATAREAAVAKAVPMLGQKLE